MGHSRIQSRFRDVYIGLAVVWLGATLGIALFINSWVYPSVISMRARDTESLIRSHQMALLLNDNRAVRDELLRRGAIAQDQDFDELRPGNKDDQAKILEIAHACHFVTAQTCAGPKTSLIYSEEPQGASSQASFVISLATHRFTWISDLWIYKVLAGLGIGLILAVVGAAIRHQEKYLLERLRLVLGSFSRAERVYAPANGIEQTPAPTDPPLDEFTLISEGIVQTETLLESRTHQMEEYKRKFEAKARLEQMAQTITYASHELKAPLLESIQFYRDLPDFLESLPKEKLVSAARSLENRARLGVRSLEKALTATRDMQLTNERIDLRLFLLSFQRRIQKSPVLHTARLEVVGHPGASPVLIEGCSSELEGALWNLVRNSMDARFNCRISISAGVESGEAVIHYKDDGPGIPEESRERVFEELYTTKPQGSGLGLAIVRKTMERARGQIRALSSTSGAHFEMRFPLLERAAGTAPDPSTQRGGIGAANA